LISLLIGLVDKSALAQTSGAITFDMRNYERGTATARLHDPAGTYRPDIGEAFEIWTDAGGTHRLWGGQVESVKETRYGTGAAATYLDIQATGWACILDRRILTGLVGFNGLVYQAATPREIISDIITVQLAGEGLTLYADSGATGSTSYAVTVAGSTLTYSVVPTFALQDNQTIRLSGVGATTYYVISATSTTFQVATTMGGSAVSPGGGSPQTAATIIDRIVFDHVFASDAISQVATLAGYVWWVDEDEAVHFAPSNQTAAAFDLTNTSGNFRNMTVTRTRQDKRNRQFRRIGIGYAARVASTVGDGATQEWAVGMFDVDYAPYAFQLANVVEVTVNDVVQELGTYQLDTDKAFYWRLGDTKLYQDAAGTPLAATDTLVVKYHYIGQDVFSAELTADITATGTLESTTGLYEAIEEDTASLDYIGAVNRCRAILGVFGDNQEAVSYETDTDGLIPGAKQNIDVSAFDINADFVINSIRASVVDGLFFRYQVEAIALATPKQNNAVDFFKSMSGGGGGGGTSATGSIGGTVTTSTGISGIEVMTPSAGHIAPVIGANFTHEITLGANVTLDAPASPTAEAIFCIKLNQDATGGRTVTFGAFYTGMSGFSLDTTALTYASLTFQINAAGTSAALIQIPINGSPIA